MHHKFVVVDFNKPTARVCVGSYNFSSPADVKNGENLLVIRDRRIAVSYAVEAMSMLDHYHFRVLQLDAKKAKKSLSSRGHRASRAQSRGGTNTIPTSRRFATVNFSLEPVGFDFLAV